jgi:microcin C transport system substrate-binding protein
MKRIAIVIFIIGALVLSGQMVIAQEKIFKSHAVTIHETNIKYGPGFKHFDYVNPNAPKGGAVRLFALGTFDDLNGHILKGTAAAGLGYLYDTLLVRSYDEPNTDYGLLAETIELPSDRSWAIFTLRKEARWHDGKPITADDVIWTFQTLKTKGHPQYRFYYANVDKAEKVSPQQVKFIFSGGENRELPVIIGEMPVLPKHYWEKHDFEKTTLEAPLGSGPYKIDQVDPGRSITYTRVTNYWAKDLAVTKGFYNFNSIRYDYYRDPMVAIEAFKAGEYDFRAENIAKSWATAYDVPAFKEGLIKKEMIRHENPAGMQAFVYNLRRPIFQDRRVREALAYVFDFEWANKNLFYGQYTRDNSYYSNSELASRGLPGPEELKILEPFRSKIPEEVFTKEYKPPVTDGSGQIRPQLAEALRLLNQAGWSIQNGKLAKANSNEFFSFEILLSGPDWERIVLPFKKNLERLGIEANVRTVDAAQYEKRIENFDFDMIVQSFGQSPSPGNEQRDFWGSAVADQPGSRNVIGIKDPVIDALVNLIIAAPDRNSLIYRTRALDRVLLWGHYCIPNWHIPYYRLIYWDKFIHPATTPKYHSLGFETWWVDKEKEAKLKAKKASLKSN